ncbi:MAG: rhamnulokinase [Oscillospiraceae bacterium]|nr:rhamnulokinase [Oscillospiraceae bacterium]
MGRVLVFDFGASGGRAMLAEYNGEKIHLDEIHRFSNDPVMVCGTFYWDILRLFHEIKQGIIKANAAGGFDSIGIDTWGVDFGIIGSDGRLLENPVNYRDVRTNGILPKAYEYMSAEELYSITGNQIMEINTAFQLLSVKLYREGFLEKADKLLLTPDLLGYMLTGEKYSEISIASTTQLLDSAKGDWSDKVIDAFGIPRKIFPEIIPSGTVVGTLSEDICTELNVPSCKVTAVCGHDTQCAAAAVPAKEKDFIFISCGTWSLFGTETDTPVMNKQAAEYNVTNEIGYGGRITFLKNIIGLWFVQETRRYMSKCGEDYSFTELEKLALECEPFKCFIDPDAPEFVPPGDIPGRVKEYCRRTGQYVPETLGQVMRCIYESLAMKYRQSLEEISACTGKSYDKIYMVGGGIQGKLLCRLAASVCGCTVSAGPVEATAYGNAAIQLIACGEIPSIEEARRIIGRSEELEIYQPENIEICSEAYERYKAVLGK